MAQADPKWSRPNPTQPNILFLKKMSTSLSLRKLLLEQILRCNVLIATVLPTTRRYIVMLLLCFVCFRAAAKVSRMRTVYRTCRRRRAVFHKFSMWSARLANDTLRLVRKCALFLKKLSSSYRSNFSVGARHIEPFAGATLSVLLAQSVPSCFCALLAHSFAICYGEFCAHWFSTFRPGT